MNRCQHEVEAQVRAREDLNHFWKVVDDAGHDFGTYDRYTATVLWDKLKREHPDREIGITKVEPVGSCQ